MSIRAMHAVKVGSK